MDKTSGPLDGIPLCKKHLQFVASHLRLSILVPTPREFSHFLL